MSEGNTAVAEAVAVPDCREDADDVAMVAGCTAVGAVAGLLGRSFVSVLKGGLLGLAVGVAVSAAKKNGGIDIERYDQDCAEDMETEKSAACVAEAEQEAEL